MPWRATVLRSPLRVTAAPPGTSAESDEVAGALSGVSYHPNPVINRFHRADTSRRRHHHRSASLVTRSIRDGEHRLDASN